MKPLLFLWIILSALIYTSCMSSRFSLTNDSIKKEAPPGGLLISGNFYCD